MNINVDPWDNFSLGDSAHQAQRRASPLSTPSMCHEHAPKHTRSWALPSGGQDAVSLILPHCVVYTSIFRIKAKVFSFYFNYFSLSWMFHTKLFSWKKSLLFTNSLTIWHILKCDIGEQLWHECASLLSLSTSHPPQVGICQWGSLNTQQP